jgi:multicomponent Na+:H+ antiporter subunit B
MINAFEKYSIKFLSSILLFVLIIFSLYILIFGKFTPGGGFQAGAILASGIIM